MDQLSATCIGCGNVFPSGVGVAPGVQGLMSFSVPCPKCGGTASVDTRPPRAPSAGGTHVIGGTIEGGVIGAHIAAGAHNTTLEGVTMRGGTVGLAVGAPPVPSPAPSAPPAPPADDSWAKHPLKILALATGGGLLVWAVQWAIGHYFP